MIGKINQYYHDVEAFNPHDIIVCCLPPIGNEQICVKRVYCDGNVVDGIGILQYVRVAWSPDRYTYKSMMRETVSKFFNLLTKTTCI